MPHGGGGAGAFLVGPALLTLLGAFLACAILAGAWSGRLGRMAALAERARGRCRAATALWGLSAGVLVFAVSAVLVQTHVLALFGIAFLLAGVVVLSFGLGVAAWAAGGAVLGAFGGGAGAGRALGVGGALLLLASCLPFAGWLLCLVGVASGTGAVLEVLLSRGGPPALKSAP